MDRLIELGNLLDCYGGLLTERQFAILSQYAYEDCSLSEISEREGISRQGVSDCINKSEKQLRKYEKELQILGNKQKRNSLISELNGFLNKENITDRTVLDSILAELKSIG